MLPNIYNLSDTDHPGDNSDTSAKQHIYPTLDGSTGIFVTIGQSRIASNSSAPASPYTPTNGAKCLNLNPYDGTYYFANDPVLGASASVGFLNTGWHGRLCDALVNASKYTQVVLIPIAIAGSSVTEWDSGGPYRDRIRAVAAMLTAMGITPTAWLWQQGTTDSINGMNQTTYQTTLRSVISYERSLSGRSADRWMIAQDTINGAANNVSTAIRAAQAAVAGDSNNFLGPDCDTLTFPTNSDGTHFNDTGNAAVTGLWSTKIRADF
jgi:hypothetical protein